MNLSNNALTYAIDEEILVAQGTGKLMLKD